MKAISLWQPWASLMAVGAKKNETRHWPTKHRGDLVICAAKHWDDGCYECLSREIFQHALNADYAGITGRVQKYNLPFGCAVAVVEMVDCKPSEEINSVRRMLDVRELEFGNYSPGRFAWITVNVRKLKNIVPIKGRQGFWNVTPMEEKLIMEQL